MLARRIADHLQALAPESCCDRCIAEALALRSDRAVRPITSAFGLTSDYARTVSVCSTCRQQSWITRAVKPASWLAGDQRASTP